MTTITETLITADELLGMQDDDQLYELAEGRLETMSLPGWEHGEIVSDLHLLIGNFVKVGKLGKVLAAETGFLLQRDPDTVRGPDVGFISQARIPENVDRRKHFPGAPDLAVEVISPSDAWTKVRKKIDEYLNAGTKLVWIIDPSAREVEVWRADRSRTWLKEADTLDGETVLPGFQLTVRDLFPQP